MLKPLALALLLPLPALAETWGAAPPDDVARIEVLPGWREGDIHVAALRITLAPGWKTYWRAPGEGGLRPVISFDGSRDLGGVRLEWPVPQVFHANGILSIGYHDELVLPLILRARAPGAPIRLQGEVQIGVCDTVCLPWSGAFGADLPAPGAPDPAIRTALDRRAHTGAEAGAGPVRCQVDPIDDGLRLTATLPVPRQGRNEVVVIEAPGTDIWVSEAIVQRHADQLVATADLVPPEAQPFPVDRSALRFTIIGDGRAVDITGCQGG